MTVFEHFFVMYSTIVLLTLDPAALKIIQLEFLYFIMLYKPMTDRGLMQNIEISQSGRVQELGQIISSWGLETMYSAQVPLDMLASTETFLPIKDQSSLFQIIPEPSNPIVINPYFLIPQNPVQKLRSEGLMGAYFILMRYWPLFLRGSGQLARIGVLPYLRI